MKYNAFISYTSKDKDCAIRLERDLCLLAQSECNKSFCIFRDDTYSQLKETVSTGLKRSLEESQWLIVICSQYINNSEKTGVNWVDFECNYFAHSLNREAAVLCFISDTAPLAKDISTFFPKSIQTHSNVLAAEGRSRLDWFNNIVKVYLHILGRSLDEFNPLVKFLLERDYLDQLRNSFDIYQDGKAEKASALIEEIPYAYGVKGLEWELLYALETNYFYPDFLGKLFQYAGKQSVCYDKQTALLCSADAVSLFIIDCINLVQIACINAHDGKCFQFQIGVDHTLFATLGEDSTVRFWSLTNRHLQNLYTVPVQITFYKGQPAVFSKFYFNGSLEKSLACFDHAMKTFAVITGSTISVIDLANYTIKVLPIPNATDSILDMQNWEALSFSENDQFLFLINKYEVLGWDMVLFKQCFMWQRCACVPILPTVKSFGFFIVGTDYHVEKHTVGCGALFKGKTLISSFTLTEFDINSAYLLLDKTHFLIILYESGAIQLLLLEQPKATTVYVYKGECNPKQNNCQIALRDNGLWNKAVVSQLAAEASICHSKECFLVYLNNEQLAFWDIDSMTPILNKETSGGVYDPMYDAMLKDYLDKKESLGLPTVDLGEFLTQNHSSIVNGNNIQNVAYAASDCFIVYADYKGETLFLFTRNGNYCTSRAICDRKSIVPLTPNEMKLPKNYSKMLFEYVNLHQNPGLFACTTLEFLSADCVAVGCDKGQIFFWKIGLNELVQVGKHTSAIISLCHNKDSNQLVSADASGFIKVWDKQGVLLEQWATGKTPTSIQILSSRRVALSDSVGTVFLINFEKDVIKVETGEEFGEFYVTADERRLVICRKNELIFYRILDGKKLLRIPFPYDICSFRFCKQESILIVIASEKVYQYETPRLFDQPRQLIEGFLSKRRAVSLKYNNEQN